MAIKVILLFLVGCGVCAMCANERKLIGSNRCTWGPNYWCKDYAKAVECDAVQHCRENVWKLKSPDMDPCTLCKLAIKRVKNILDEATVQEQLLAFLKDVCDNAGLGPFTDECKDIVKKYEPDIIKNLDKLLANSEKVCAKMGMCKAQRVSILASLISDAKPRMQVQVFRDGLTDWQKCLICKSIKDDLDKIPNRTKRIEVPLQQACNRVSNKKKCQWTIAKLLPVIISIMKTKVNQVCANYNTESCKVTPRVAQHGNDTWSVMGTHYAEAVKTWMYCMVLRQPCGLAFKDFKMGLHVMTPKKLQDFGCDFCMYFMGEAEAILKNTSFTEKQFEKMVLTLCDQFKFMEYKCKQMIDRYLPLLYEMLTELKPYQVCQEIQMCPTAAAADLKKDPRCFLGASFWCASLMNAERCSALQYCKSHVWQAQIQ